jgi:hypothetical protein
MLMRLHYEFCIDIAFIHFLEQLKMDKRIYYIPNFKLCNLVMSKLLFLSKYRPLGLLFWPRISSFMCVYT